MTQQIIAFEFSTFVLGGWPSRMKLTARDDVDYDHHQGGLNKTLTAHTIPHTIILILSCLQITIPITDSGNLVNLYNSLNETIYVT